VETLAFRVLLAFGARLGIWVYSMGFVRCFVPEDGRVGLFI
jgi:hypothetical protein